VLDHVTITVSDFAASLRFYDAVLGELGMQRLHELGDEEESDSAVEVAAYGTDEQASIWVTAGPVATTRVHLAFRASSSAQVEAFHAAALATGGSSHDAPRRWPIFRRGDFNAIVRDPDGNLLEAIAPE
jgi:catechol 2,3-dioxygenase-like lactoylglutathione lyase family enzyme